MMTDNGRRIEKILRKSKKIENFGAPGHKFFFVTFYHLVLFVYWFENAQQCTNNNRVDNSTGNLTFKLVVNLMYNFSRPSGTKEIPNTTQKCIENKKNKLFVPCVGTHARQDTLYDRLISIKTRVR